MKLFKIKLSSYAPKIEITDSARQNEGPHAPPGSARLGLGPNAPHAFEDMLDSPARELTPLTVQIDIQYPVLSTQHTALRPQGPVTSFHWLVSRKILPSWGHNEDGSGRMHLQSPAFLNDW